MSRRTVYIVGGGLAFINMFDKNRDKFRLFSGEGKDAWKADIIVFPGGADINPRLYGEGQHKSTYYIDSQDNIDRSFFEMRKKNPDITMVGVCRGAQFLNVMNGGNLWQDVNNHRQRHRMTDLLTDKEIEVTSTHHQMIRNVGDGGEILGIANIATEWRTEKLDFKSKTPDHRDPGHPPYDI
jgi:phosphoribosylformylglycinamidine (FGAM) synthase-like amidotransferase family enzyme